jgi:hypothetical protein
MTLLQPQMPVLSIEDSLQIVYHGTYGVLRYERQTNINHIDEVKGPLPVNKFVWDGIDHLGGMKKGEKRIVPFDVIRVFFGDPRAMPTRQRFEDRKGNVGDIAPRPEETRRLSVLYGLYDTDSTKVSKIVPAVTITTADDTEVICPSTDPGGLHVYGHVTESADNYDLATTIEQMKMQIRLLEDQAKAQAKKGHDNSGADVEVDGPRAAPA